MTKLDKLDINILKYSHLPVEISTKLFKVGDFCRDVIMYEDKSFESFKSDKNSIAFFSPERSRNPSGNFSCTDKESLEAILKDPLSYLSECPRVDSMRGVNNFSKDFKHLNLIKLPFGGGGATVFVLRGSFESFIESKDRIAAISPVLLEDGQNVEILSSASFDVIYGDDLERGVSGYHCQSGSNLTIYKMSKVILQPENQVGLLDTQIEYNEQLEFARHIQPPRQRGRGWVQVREDFEDFRVIGKYLIKIFNPVRVVIITKERQIQVFDPNEYGFFHREGSFVIKSKLDGTQIKRPLNTLLKRTSQEFGEIFGSMAEDEEEAGRIIVEEYVKVLPHSKRALILRVDYTWKTLDTIENYYYHSNNNLIVASLQNGEIVNTIPLNVLFKIDSPEFRGIFLQDGIDEQEAYFEANGILPESDDDEDDFID